MPLRQFFITVLFISALFGSEARATDPSNTIICICNYANGLMAKRKQKDAVLLLEQVFKRNPDYELCRTNLSVAYNNLAVESKEPQEALRYASRALVLCPKDKSALQNLDFAMHNANLTLTDSASHVKYGDTLKQQGDNVGAYQQFLFAMKDATGDVAEIQKKVDELITPEEAAKWGTRGGVGAGVLFQAIQLDESKDAAFQNLITNPMYAPFKERFELAGKRQLHWAIAKSVSFLWLHLMAPLKTPNSELHVATN